MGNYISHAVMKLVDSSSPCYIVHNVDAKLSKHLKGKMKITCEALVLHYDDSNSEIKWILKGIRRYGYHKDIFLFECGRMLVNTMF